MCDPTNELDEPLVVVETHRPLHGHVPDWVHFRRVDGRTPCWCGFRHERNATDFVFRVSNTNAVEVLDPDNRQVVAEIFVDRHSKYTVTDVIRHLGEGLMEYGLICYDSEIFFDVLREGRRFVFVQAEAARADLSRALCGGVRSTGCSGACHLGVRGGPDLSVHEIFQLVEESEGLLRPSSSIAYYAVIDHDMVGLSASAIIAD